MKVTITLGPDSRLGYTSTVEGIDRVLERLQVIVDESIRERSRDGYFAAMYQRVTRRVKEGIERGDFDDGARMSQFDALFAEHYFRAREQFQNSIESRESWRVAFAAASSGRPLIVQHLLLGMNAHIYLDLGIAAAQTSPGAAYPTLEGDFRRINQILFDELDPTEDRVGKLSPGVRVLDLVLGGWDEWFGRTALAVVRESAWEFGARLAQLDQTQWPSLIAARDRHVAQVAHLLLEPGFPTSWAIRIVRLLENDDVEKGIRTLS